MRGVEGWRGARVEGGVGCARGCRVGITSAAAKLSGLLPAAAYSETASQEPAAPADAVTADVGLLKL